MASEPLLQVRGLKVRFATEDGTVRAVDGVDFELERGQVLGIVGESGSGKSVTALTVLGLTRATNTMFEGEVVYKGTNLLTMPERQLRAIRGKEIAMIFQDPMTSVILITHDLGVVADVADEILVMYAGRVVERAAKRSLFYDSQMPYTWGLLGSIPRLDQPKGGRLASIKGAPPSLINLPTGCKFRPRCPHAFEKCAQEPELVNRVEERSHLDRCWLPVDEKRTLREATIKGEVAAA